MSNTTVFRNAAWLIAWDQERASHVYRRDVDLAIRGSEIVFIGKRYPEAADTEVDCSRRLLLPGLVNIHSHPTSEPLRKGITDETRSPGFWHSSLYEFLTVFNNDAEGAVAAMRVALAELLLSGVTTVVDLSVPFEGWLDTLAEFGIRAVAAPMFRDARWFTKNGHQLDYAWDKKAGREAFEHARRLIDLAHQHPSQRLSGMLCPAQIDTCSPELIRDAYDYAIERRLALQIHASQSVNEFHEMFRRYGKTPIAWLNRDRGAGPADHHRPRHLPRPSSWLHWPTRGDLPLLRDTGRDRGPLPDGVHAPRHRHEHVWRPMRARASISASAPTPTRTISSRRCAAPSRSHARWPAPSTMSARSTSSTPATLGGARALLRDDIGRLKVGAKADLVLVDIKHPSMMPMREPLRSLLYVAADRAVRDVYVDGQRVVADQRVLNIDHRAAAEALEEAQKRSMREVPSSIGPAAAPISWHRWCCRS